MEDCIIKNNKYPKNIEQKPSFTKKYAIEANGLFKSKNAFSKKLATKFYKSKNNHLLFQKMIYRNNQKIKCLLKNKFFFNFNIILLMLISTFIPISFAEICISKLRHLNYDSEITMTIKGTGNQVIIYKDFKSILYEVKVNGVTLEKLIIQFIYQKVKKKILLH